MRATPSLLLFPCRTAAPGPSWVPQKKESGTRKKRAPVRNERRYRISLQIWNSTASTPRFPLRCALCRIWNRVHRPRLLPREQGSRCCLSYIGKRGIYAPAGAAGRAAADSTNHRARAPLVARRRRCYLSYPGRNTVQAQGFRESVFSFFCEIFLFGVTAKKKDRKKSA